jgi:hypothetical protein
MHTPPAVVPYVEPAGQIISKICLVVNSMDDNILMDRTCVDVYGSASSIILSGYLQPFTVRHCQLVTETCCMYGHLRPKPNAESVRYVCLGIYDYLQLVNCKLTVS